MHVCDRHSTSIFIFYNFLKYSFQSAFKTIDNIYLVIFLDISTKLINRILLLHNLEPYPPSGPWVPGGSHQTPRPYNPNPTPCSCPIPPTLLHSRVVCPPGSCPVPNCHPPPTLYSLPNAAAPPPSLCHDRSPCAASSNVFHSVSLFVCCLHLDICF